MLFDKVFTNPKWRGKDSFPSCKEFKIEINKWIEFIKDKNQLQRYKPRINDLPTKRDEALAEICSAYIVEEILKYPIIDWEVETISNKNVDFVIESNNKKYFCEVKSPGWIGELTQEERLTGRKEKPKYVHAEVRSIAPWERVRFSINKANTKFLPNCYNLVIINHNLFNEVLFNDERNIPMNIDIALYEENGVYNNEKGYFADNRYDNIGGILIIEYRLLCGSTEVEYAYNFFANRNAKKPFSLRVS